MLMVFRIVQGATGGALQPLSQAILLEAFPPEDRGKAMAFWGLGIVVAPMLGPVLGGWLTDNYSWRWIFYINVPIGIAVDRHDAAFIFDPPYIQRGPRGSTTGASACWRSASARCRSCSTRGRRRIGSARASSSTAGHRRRRALVVLRHSRTDDEHPVVDLRVFRDRTYATGVFLMTVLGLRALRQHGAAADLAADAAGISALRPALRWRRAASAPSS